MKMQFKSKRFPSSQRVFNRQTPQTAIRGNGLVLDRFLRRLLYTLCKLRMSFDVKRRNAENVRYNSFNKINYDLWRLNWSKIRGQSCPCQKHRGAVHGRLCWTMVFSKLDCTSQHVFRSVSEIGRCRHRWFTQNSIGRKNPYEPPGMGTICKNILKTFSEEKKPKINRFIFILKTRFKVHMNCGKQWIRSKNRSNKLRASPHENE